MFNSRTTSLLGQKNAGKKAPKMDRELGYSDFTLTLSFNTPPQQERMKLSPIRKKYKKQGGRWSNPKAHRAEDQQAGGFDFSESTP